MARMEIGRPQRMSGEEAIVDERVVRSEWWFRV
jgi:hypothetical protein